MNGVLFIVTLNSMTNLDSLTGHRLANYKRVGRSNYWPLDCHKQRKVASFRKNQCVFGLFGEIQIFSDCAESLHEPWEKRFTPSSLVGRATHRRDEYLPCQSHEPVWRCPPTILQELAH